MLGALGESFRVDAWYRLRRLTRRRRNAEARLAFEKALAGLRPGDLCIDCGANFGSITARLADTGATVHAFEPNPIAFQALVRTLGKRNNVVLHNTALGVGNGTVRLYLSASMANSLSGTQRSSIVPFKTNIAPDRFVDVPKVDFVEFARSLGQPLSFVKMDIEGAEVGILKEVFKHHLHKTINQMFVETHEKQIPQLRGETMALVQRSRAAGNINCDWW